ncbi:M10 family metallopeptidase [Nitrosomonas sp. Nm166]|uniref:M10 family metallopeptidase n=1 Tax=Nitrosomonas sp. Nm166 TaxID=1881054 RepID=UPI0008EA2A36|nr:M10 family metallopeptidase [Nitrosomonas sp. Nm166]SFE59192.1 serralysin [Nitrosomonas sp. Nm166]
MAFSNPVTSPSAGNAYIDGLLWGSHWNDPAAGTRLKVYIAGQNGNEVFDFGGTAVTARTASSEITAFLRGMQLIENVSNIDFQTAMNKADADIIVGAVNNSDAGGGLGGSVPPGEDTGPVADRQGAEITNFDAYFSTDYSSLKQGGYDFVTVIHEFGHTIGLKHPHDPGGDGRPNFPGVTTAFGDYGDFNLNQGLYTMMTYNDGWQTGPKGPLDSTSVSSYGYQGTPMAFDIAALQFLYGANTSFQAGNDVYALNAANTSGTFYSCIWDTGGIDTIRNPSSTNSTIDLRAATLQHAPGGGGYLSAINGIDGGFTIAKGAVIENATGGAGVDVITGNAAANALNGKAGNDRISGLGGADKIIGGGGADVLTGGGGADDFVYTAASDSSSNKFDVIRDFAHKQDDINVSAIDANGAATGNAAFVFRGSSAFTGAGAEVRFTQNVAKNFTSVLFDIDGDRISDMTIRLTGPITLDAADFIL